MIKNHLKQVIIERLGFSPTTEQKKLISLLSNFVLDESFEPMFLLKGYAGTGKTSVIGAMAKVMQNFEMRAIMLAPTGRAAKVLSKYSAQPAYTIHKRIYRQKSSTDGMGEFTLDKNLYRNTLFIVDEASMISNQSLGKNLFGTGRLLDDLIEYVYSGDNCKLLIVGDTAQLPPVGLTISPALDIDELDKYGKTVTHIELTEVVRQIEDSTILLNATHIRRLLKSESLTNNYFKIELDSEYEIQRIGGHDLVEKISESYDRFGIEETIVITRSNKRANRFNDGIRSSILFCDETISQGDKLMVVKNNYYWIDDNDQFDFIANGDTVEIIRIHGYESRYGFRFANITLKMDDYDNVELDCKIILNTLSIEAASLSYEQQMNLFKAVAEDYADIRNKKERWKRIRENEYFNALQVKFAYAVTCHKAQGGQWKSVFIDQGYLLEDMINQEFLRWLYTAFTRATEKLFLVNFNNQFFNKEDTDT